MTKILCRWRSLRRGSAVLLIGLLAACGDNAPTPDAAAAELTMEAAEFRFAPAPSALTARTPYRFVVRNTGAVAHEWVVTPTSADAHAHDAHGDALSAIGSADLGPGASATRELSFPAPGSYEVACHLPGHYEAGMRLTLTVQ